MARANPLMQRRPLPPVAEDTQSDFVKRMAAASSFGRTAAPGPDLSSTLAKGKGAGNAVKITVDPEDKLPSDYAENKEPYANIAFGIFKQDPAQTYTLVESSFHQIFNNQLQMNDEEAKPLDSIGPNEMETAVYDRLIRWSRRLHKLFLMAQGLLAGLCMLHLYLLLEDTSDQELFVTGYARFTRVIATFFHALVLIALLGALHRTLSERSHYLRIEQTEIDYDVEKHRRPYFIAMACAVCYAVCYVFTIFNSSVSNEMYWNYELNIAWASLLDSSFKSKLKGWTYLCVIREILAIIAWIILCSQGYWNVGTAYKHKIVMLKRTGGVQPRFVAEEVYRHLFFGNPYLPNGVFTLAEDEPVAETKKAS